MIRPVLICLIVMMGTMAATAPAQETGFDQIEVKIKGFLDKPSGPRASQPFPYVIKSRGLLIHLDLSSARNADKVSSHLDELVELDGSLQRLDRDRIVCKVTGEIRAVKVQQYLVGYEANQLEQVKKASLEIGLKIREDYKPGKYLVMIATADFNRAKIDGLKKSDGVRYIEPNRTVSIRDPDKK